MQQEQINHFSKDIDNIRQHFGPLKVNQNHREAFLDLCDLLDRITDKMTKIENSVIKLKNVHDG